MLEGATLDTPTFFYWPANNSPLLFLCKTPALSLTWLPLEGLQCRPGQSLNSDPGPDGSTGFRS